MKKKISIPLLLTALCACAMLVLFVVQVSLMQQPNQLMSFSVRYGNIAYGYVSSSVASSVASSAASSAAAVCGNGTKESTEGCDDGNTTAGDGCSATCTVESGYSCTGTAPSVCTTICGDGLKKGSEGCDDGNTTSGDGCSATCTVESGYSCTGTAPSVCSTTCGDGIVAGSEQCDTGGESSTCNSDCTTAVCGDGKVNTTAGEQCDNGSSNNNAGTCSMSCKKTYCGDGVVQTPNGNGQDEECEPALDSSCSASCTVARGVGATSITTPSTTTPLVRLSPPADCGNLIIDTDKGETCDDGLLNGLDGHCDRWCHAIFCGNGVIDTGEECEPQKDGSGNFIDVTCGKACTVPTCDASGNCTGGCTWKFQPACKSGSTLLTGSPNVLTQIANGIEQIVKFPAGSSSSSNQSFILPAPGPSGVMTLVPSGALCGNGVVDPGEECDRGTVKNAIGLGCTPICKISICGNGILEPGEECDDGPRNSDTKPDSCSKKCLLPHCGDGIVDRAFGEVCDNGMKNSNTLPNACRMNCLPAHCGDGVKDTGEQCDNGAANSDTTPGACRMNCKVARCGDHVTDPGEQCDDGPNGSKTCTPSCKLIAQPVTGLAALETPQVGVSLVVFFILLVLIAGRRMQRRLTR